MSGQIFISYRREESRWSARDLCDRLTQRFDRNRSYRLQWCGFHFSPGGLLSRVQNGLSSFAADCFPRFARSIRIVTAKFEKRGLSGSGPRKLLNLTGREPRFAGRCVYRPRVKPARRGRKVEGGRALVPLPSALGGICKPATSARWPRNLDRFGHPGKSFSLGHSPSPYPFPFSSRRRFSSNAALINAKCVNACGKLPRCSPDGLNSSAKRPK